jgi:hypothetical protein
MARFGGHFGFAWSRSIAVALSIELPRSKHPKASSTPHVLAPSNVSSTHNLSSTSNLSSVLSQRLNAFRTQLEPLSGAVALYDISSPQYGALHGLS